MKKPTLAEFKAWLQARQKAAADAIPDAPRSELESLYRKFSRASNALKEIECFTDELEKGGQ